MKNDQSNVNELGQKVSDLRNEMQDLTDLADAFGSKLVSSFASAVIHGKTLSDTLRGMLQGLAQTALTAAVKPLGAAIGGLFAGTPTPFADGGIVNAPTLFGMGGGLGLMGEAGPEAIMPLARGPDGALGVRGAGGGANVTINIQTPDVQSFAQSQNQVAAMVSRALARSQRNM